MNEKHAPGPWGIGRFGNSRYSGWTVQVPGEPYLHVVNHSDRSEANARLIAAAPELLAACKRMRDIIDSDEQEGNWECTCVKGDACPGCAVLRAIAKAEGGT